MNWNRRRFLLALPMLAPTACDKRAPPQEVVVYTSVDDVFARPIAELFQKQTRHRGAARAGHRGDEIHRPAQPPHRGESEARRRCVLERRPDARGGLEKQRHLAAVSVAERRRDAAGIQRCGGPLVGALGAGARHHREYAARSRIGTAARAGGFSRSRNGADARASPTRFSARLRCMPPHCSRRWAT